MTEQEWSLTIHGEGQAWCVYQGEHTRLRNIVAEEIAREATMWRRQGRLELAGRLAYLASILRTPNGRLLTKRILDKVWKHLEPVRARLVDGVPLCRWTAAGEMVPA